MADLEVTMHPKRAYSILLPLLVATFLVSGIGHDRTRSEGGLYWVGAIGWFTFCAVLVVTILFSIITLAQLVRRRSAVGTVAEPWRGADPPSQ